MGAWPARLLLLSLLLIAGLVHPSSARAQSEDIDAAQKRVEALLKTGKYQEARPLAEGIVALARTEMGEKHPATATSLILLAEILRQLQQPEKAARHEQVAIEIRVATLGAEHPETAKAIRALAGSYRQLGRYADAEPLYKRALAILENALGADHLDVAGSLNGIAEFYRTQARYADAESLYRQSLSTREKALGRDHPDVGESLNNLAENYREQGRYAEAEPLFNRVLAIRERASGPDHPDVARALNDIAALYHQQGRYAEAEPLYRRSLAIVEKRLGPDHLEIAVYLQNLAGLYLFAQGRNDDAERLLTRSLAITEGALGPTHPDVSTRLNNLAVLYRQQGRYSEAEPLFRRSLAIRETALGPDHLMVGTSLTNLAGLYQLQGRYADAEQLFMHSLAIRERVLGHEHRDVGGSLNNLAVLYGAQDRFLEAESHFKRSLTILEKTLGSDHPDVASLLSNLAVLYFAQRNWSMAVELLRGGTLVTLGRTKRGVETLGRVSRVSPKEGRAFEVLVKASYRLGEIEPKRVDELTASTFQATQWVLGSNAAAALTQMAARQAKSGGALTRLMRERQDLVGEWGALDARLITARSQSLDKRNAGAEQVLQTRLSAIDTRIPEIDRSLVIDFPDYAALASPRPLAIAEVQALLRPEEALVLFLDTSAAKPVPAETFIWVVTKTHSRWMRNELGTRPLTERVAALRCGLDSAAWIGEEALRCAELLKMALDKSPKENEALPFDVASAHDLYQALFGGVTELINGKHLLIVPSGPLTQLPFQVLVTEKPDPRPTGANAFRRATWLAKYHAITVLPAVSSLKALRQHAKASRATKQLIGFGNALLDGPDGRHQARAKLARDKGQCPKTAWKQLAGLSGVRAGIEAFSQRAGLVDVADIRALTPLPETADELCAVARDLGVPHGDIHLGNRATERNIKSMSEAGSLANYQIVHFATHGALAGELQAGAEPGLILTPPNKGTAEDDGYLSASEIAGLKLDADWVILSACNTAAGGAQGAEALSGLARAFFYAGARALLVSHWAVYSDSTVKLITNALSTMAADKTVGRSEALRRSMLALIEKGEPHEAHPAYWAPFVVVGEGRAEEPFKGSPSAAPPSSTGRPTRPKKRVSAPDWRTEVWR